MDVSRGRYVLALAFVLVGLVGCANFETIDRTSSVPWHSEKGADGKGLAIHLDAQQRLVVFAAERYCAEPSPDALAAYAAAIGLSGSKLPSQSEALSAAVDSTAGSIGLRTQSITLMRDTLYRICEGGMNQFLSEEQVAVLLARSQDLTAVVLAVEQLTGAVTAPPITLSTGGGSSSLASITANTQALNAANAARDAAKVDSDEAESLRVTAENDKTTASEALEKARDGLKNGDGTTQDQVDKLQTDYLKKSTSYDTAAQNAKTKADAYERLKETAEQIALAHDAANNTTTASVVSTGNFGATRPPVSEATIKAVSSDVRNMVESLLNKPYLEQICLAVVTSPGATKSLTAITAAGTAAISNAGNVSLFTTQNADIKKSVARTAQLAVDAQSSRIELVNTCLQYFNAMAKAAGERAATPAAAPAAPATTTP